MICKPHKLTFCPHRNTENTLLNRDKLICYEKYELILDLMAATCLKKVAIGATTWTSSALKKTSTIRLIFSSQFQRISHVWGKHQQLSYLERLISAEVYAGFRVIEQCLSGKVFMFHIMHGFWTGLPADLSWTESILSIMKQITGQRRPRLDKNGTAFFSQKSRSCSARVPDVDELLLKEVLSNFFDMLLPSNSK